jgi:hypothetical protein
MGFLLFVSGVFAGAALMVLWAAAPDRRRKWAY